MSARDRYATRLGAAWLSVRYPPVSMSATQPPVDSRAVRERLVEALRLDLVGPWAGHELDAEQLPGRERPSNWYVAGFLIPTGAPPERSADADEDDGGLDQVDARPPRPGSEMGRWRAYACPPRPIAALSDLR